MNDDKQSETLTASVPDGNADKTDILNNETETVPHSAPETAENVVTAEKQPEPEKNETQTAAKAESGGDTDNPPETETTDEAADGKSETEKTEKTETTEKPMSPLEKVNAELADLEKTADEETADEKPLPVENTDDSAAGADEVGVSGIYDDYNREILEPVFENKLRMSVNSVKLAYGKVKNTILSYKGMSQKYDGDREIFLSGRKTLFKIEIGAENSLYLYLKLEKEISDEEFCHTLMKGKFYGETPLKLTVKKGADNKTSIPLDKALTLVGSVMEENKIGKRTVYVPTAYAERYPLNPEAVLRGQETVAPRDGQYDGEEYDPIENELTRNIVEELLGKDFGTDDKKGKEKLEALRQQATTIKGAVALTEPVAYFFDNALNKDNTNAFLGIRQVLNDKFLGKLLPQQYFAIAENSDRIEQLNLWALKFAVVQCDENPKVNFAVETSCRMLAKKNAYAKLLENCRTANNNLIIAFDAAMLEALGKTGSDGIDALRGIGAKIMIDRTETVGLHLLTDYAIDYLRFDSRYYTEGDTRRTALLDIMTGYANVQGIITAAENVDTTKEAKFLLNHGVNVIEGFAVSEPKRIVRTALKEIKKLPITAN